MHKIKTPLLTNNINPHREHYNLKFKLRIDSQSIIFVINLAPNRKPLLTRGALILHEVPPPQPHIVHGAQQSDVIVASRPQTSLMGPLNCINS